MSSIRWFGVSGNETKRQLWEKQIRKDRSDFVMGNSMKVCSNHFVDGEPTDSNTVPCSQ